jgi:dienelactone hydrolase
MATSKSAMSRLWLIGACLIVGAACSWGAPPPRDADLLVAAASAEAVASDAPDAGTRAASTTATAATPDARWSESVMTTPVAVRDRHGVLETHPLTLTLFVPRDQGDGPFPLAVINHGRPPERAARNAMSRQRFERISRYLMSKGLAVVVPTRIGYGETAGSFDPEETGGCAASIAPMLTAGSDEVFAARTHAATLPGIDASRWIAVGVSVGGLVSLETAMRHPPGLAAVVNFAGGVGGDPKARPGRPCSPQRVSEHLRAGAALATVPTLWLYWDNDKFWGPDIPRDWFDAWKRGGAAASALYTLPASGEDGHMGFSTDMNGWKPLVDKALADAGIGHP